MCIPGLAPRKYIEKNNGKGGKLSTKSLGLGFLSADSHWHRIVTPRTPHELSDRLTRLTASCL